MSYSVLSPSGLRVPVKAGESDWDDNEIYNIGRLNSALLKVTGMLDTTGTPTNGEVPRYNSGTGLFEFVAPKYVGRAVTTTTTTTTTT